MRVPPRTPKGVRLGGRAKGTPNRATADLRAAVKLLAENNQEKMQEWLDRTARRNPARAFEMVKDLWEFCMPRLARVEHTGEDGGAVQVQVVRFTDPAP